ncbi:putative glycosyl hydrolase [Streptomyces sp. NBRC 110611]|nr:putative glycosyl hydrolase [Streptomyces sp. NBRC 110611]
MTADYGQTRLIAAWKSAEGGWVRRLGTERLEVAGHSQPSGDGGFRQEPERPAKPVTTGHLHIVRRPAADTLFRVHLHTVHS